MNSIDDVDRTDITFPTGSIITFLSIAYYFAHFLFLLGWILTGIVILTLFPVRSRRALNTLH
ncbi:MAG: hypothetical protein ACOCXT_01175 [Candidatus Dojkabacteria bacterium]